jgi:tetratricopeptide (TPR) repeat protein
MSAQFDLAIEDFGKVIELDPRNAAAFRGRGECWGMSYRYDLAVADFDKAIWLDPKSATAYVDRSATWLLQNDYQQTIDDASSALKLDTNNDVALWCRGNAWFNLGSHERAIADFGELINLYPEEPWPYRARALAYGASGNDLGAQGDERRAASLSPETTPRLDYGWQIARRRSTQFGQSAHSANQ